MSKFSCKNTMAFAVSGFKLARRFSMTLPPVEKRRSHGALVAGIARYRRAESRPSSPWPQSTDRDACFVMRFKICCCIVIFEFLTADLAGVLALYIARLEQFPAKPGRLVVLFRWPLCHVLEWMKCFFKNNKERDIEPKRNFSGKVRKTDRNWYSSGKFRRSEQRFAFAVSVCQIVRSIWYYLVSGTIWWIEISGESGR